MVDKAVVSSIEKFLRNAREGGINVRFAVLFGSQVAGNTHEWSDIDLIVVSPKYDGNNTLDEIGKLWRIAAKTDTRIEPIPCGEKQWLEDEGTPILEVARQEGEVIRIPDDE